MRLGDHHTAVKPLKNSASSLLAKRVLKKVRSTE